MKIEIVSVDDWEVMLINGKKACEGHSIDAQYALESLLEFSHDNGLGIDFEFENTYLEDADEDGIDLEEYVKKASKK